MRSLQPHIGEVDNLVCQEGDIMSGYPSWSGTTGRMQHRECETPALTDQGYRMLEQYTNDPHMSSSSSSLIGEMSLHPWQSQSGHAYSGSTIGREIGPCNTLLHMQPNMTVPMTNTAYPDVAGHGGFGSTTVAGSSDAEIFLGDYGQSTPAIGFGAEHVAYSAWPSPPSDASDEVRRLRQRIHELERELNRSKSTIEILHNMMLNRAENALCAWHDPHRKCRAHPLRNAPPGHLNCSCTCEEALFEESPAHHGVASYLPGNMVHMHKY